MDLATKIREHFRLGSFAKIRLTPESVVEGRDRLVAVEADVYLRSPSWPSEMKIYCQERPEVAAKLSAGEWISSWRGRRFNGTLDVSSLRKDTYTLLVQSSSGGPTIATTKLHVFAQEELAAIKME
jgi:hypothetical protein